MSVFKTLTDRYSLIFKCINCFITFIQMNDRVELFAFFLLFFFFHGSCSGEVLRFGTDLQFRSYTEWKCGKKRGREEERHAIKHARDHRSVGAYRASAVDKITVGVIHLCVDGGGGQVDVAVERTPESSAASDSGADWCCLCSLRRREPSQRVQHKHRMLKTSHSIRL